MLSSVTFTLFCLRANKKDKRQNAKKAKSAIPCSFSMANFSRRIISFMAEKKISRIRTSKKGLRRKEYPKSLNGIKNS
jgi:hypothetical protein